jgi:hypothetical protein
MFLSFMQEEGILFFLHLYHFAEMLAGESSGVDLFLEFGQDEFGQFLIDFPQFGQFLIFSAELFFQFSNLLFH